MKRQGGTGDGLAENVIEAYNFIVNNFEEGDEIFCFGFSRGAYTARAVAGLVTDMGVIKPEHMQDFPALYSAYKAPNSWKKEGTKMTFQESSVWTNIYNQNLARTNGNKKESQLAIPNSKKVKVVGVWDTVGSLGIPEGRIFSNAASRREHAFHNVTLSLDIEHAFHALALDERRKPFGPTLWYIDKDLTNKTPQPKLPELKQCWFPGVHINNGGGSDDSLSTRQGDFESMANITFAWMLQCVYPYLTINEEAYKKYLDYYFSWTLNQKHSCTHHRKTWGDTAYEIADYIPYVNPDMTTKPDPVHQHPEIERGWGLGPFVDSAQGILYNGIYSPAPRMPGECELEEHKATTSTMTKISEKGATHEYMHPVAEYRHQKRTGKEPSTAPPKKLLDFDRKLIDGRYRWVKKTNPDISIPEWIIMNPGGFNFERDYYNRCLEAKNQDNQLAAKGKRVEPEEDWLKKVDEEVNFKLVKNHKIPFDYP
jgi:hypothetical protein